MAPCFSFVRRFVFVAVCLGAAAVSAEDRTTPIRIGVLAYRGSDEAHRDWRPTLEHLERALPQNKFHVETGSAAFLTAAVAAHRLDFIITNPGHFLDLKIDYSARALATEQDLAGPLPSESIGAAVFVKAPQAGIQGLADLRNTTVVATSPDAFGFRAVWRELQERGIDPFKNLSLTFVGFPVDEVIKAVRSGRAEAGIIRSCALETMIAESAVVRDEFRVVGRRQAGALGCEVSTRLYPGWPFVKVAQTSPAMASDVAKALLAMQPGADEKIWTQPDDYSSVQELDRVLKIGPYAPFRRLGLLDLLWENRLWAALAATAAAWWFVHAARVSYLVKKRTRELQKAHEAARIRGEQMEHTVRLSLMGEMASSLAHEINQPLAAILTYARGCERRIDGGADVEGVREAIGRIATQAERAGDIVRRMRDFSRKHASQQVPVDVSKVFRDAVALFEPTAKAAGIDVVADIPAQLPFVRADRLQLEEVVLNLLQNALDAVAAQGDRKIRLRVVADEMTIRISVTDNGPGLKPEVKEHLFEPFFTTKPNGLGLGLSLSQTIVEAHGGRLSADSGSQGGAVFGFYLPLIEKPVHV